jgi:hypothetical protein
MGLISIDWDTGDIKRPRNVAQDIDPLTGEGRSYRTKWIKTGSAMQKSPVKTGYRYHPERYPERKQTRQVFGDNTKKSRKLNLGRRKQRKILIGMNKR